MRRAVLAIGLACALTISTSCEAGFCEAGFSVCEAGFSDCLRATREKVVGCVTSWPARFVWWGGMGASAVMTAYGERKLFRDLIGDLPSGFMHEIIMKYLQDHHVYERVDLQFNLNDAFCSVVLLTCLIKMGIASWDGYRSVRARCCTKDLNLDSSPLSVEEIPLASEDRRPPAYGSGSLPFMAPGASGKSVGSVQYQTPPCSRYTRDGSWDCSSSSDDEEDPSTDRRYSRIQGCASPSGNYGPAFPGCLQDR